MYSCFDARLFTQFFQLKNTLTQKRIEGWSQIFDQKMVQNILLTLHILSAAISYFKCTRSICLVVWLVMNSKISYIWLSFSLATHNCSLNQHVLGLKSSLCFHDNTLALGLIKKTKYISFSFDVEVCLHTFYKVSNCCFVRFSRKNLLWSRQ